nr:PREDICTED: 5-hydroxytryptamine receptor 3E-like [Lepisosteus oculatus]
MADSFALPSKAGREEGRHASQPVKERGRLKSPSGPHCPIQDSSEITAVLRSEAKLEAPVSQVCSFRRIPMAIRPSYGSLGQGSWGGPRGAPLPGPSSPKKLAACQLVLFASCCLLLQEQSCVAAVKVNCSRPDTYSLYTVLNTALNNSALRPVISLKTPTNVNVSFTLYSILGVDDKQQVLTTFIWQVLEWDIEYLSWDPEQCGTERVSLPRVMIWVPDILINEFMSDNKSPQTPYVYIDHTGHVYDDRPLRVDSSCSLDIYNFPFDVQICSFSFGSYLHYASDVTISQGQPVEYILEESLNVMQNTGEWELVNISVMDQTLLTSNSTYDMVVYNLTIKRRPMQYVVNLLIPSCFLITVDLFSFLLPPESVDRSAFKMTLILGYTVFLLIMNDLLPDTGSTTPLINVFFSICLALMVASLLETVLITNILYSSGQYPNVPRWIRILVLQYLSRLVLLPQKTSQSNRVTVFLNPGVQDVQVVKSLEGGGNVPCQTPESQLDRAAVELLKRLSRDLQAIRQHAEKHFKSSDSSEEWCQIGHILDRLLFAIYVVFICGSFIVILAIWVGWFRT